MDDAIATKLPCPKEWLAEDEDDGMEEENFSIAELRLGQRIVGEQLWLAMRTRPDLLYPVNYMASKVTVSKQPNKVAQIGRRLMSYLKETRDIKLIVYGPQYQYDDGSGEAEAQAHSTISSASRSLGSSSNSRSRTTTESASSSLHHPQEQDPTRKRYKLPVTLHGYSDASFAPLGKRSFGACVVTINDTPVAWKAGRQAFVTLSVMEAELYEAAQASVLLESIGCLLDEVFGYRIDRSLYVDNAVSVAMINGGTGSWRTRHLKVRCAYIRDQVAASKLKVEHIEGVRQLADLATKMHPKMRLQQLLCLWCFEGVPLEAEERIQVRKLYLLCVLLALQTPSVAAMDTTPTTSTSRQSSVQLAGFDELLLVTTLVCISAIAVWEGLRALVRWFVGRSRSERRLARLERLQRMAARATQAEISRLEREAGSELGHGSGSDTDGRESEHSSPPVPPRIRAVEPGLLSRSSLHRRDANLP